jgi:hypothetical protein
MTTITVNDHGMSLSVLETMMRRANKCFNITDDKTRTVDIDRILERVAAKSLDQVRPTKGEFSQDINPEKIQEIVLVLSSVILKHLLARLIIVYSTERDIP